MRILYRDPDTETLAVTAVTNTKYDPEEAALTFFGDDDITISVSRKEAEELTRTLFEQGKLDISKYDCDYYDWPDDEDEDDEDDEDGLSFVIGPDFLADL